MKEKSSGKDVLRRAKLAAVGTPSSCRIIVLTSRGPMGGSVESVGRKVVYYPQIDFSHPPLLVKKIVKIRKATE